MDIAEMAARHVQASLPQSRGGRSSLLLGLVSSCAVSGAGSADVSTSKAFSTCDKYVPGAILRHDGGSRHHPLEKKANKGVRYSGSILFCLTGSSEYKVMELVPCEVLGSVAVKEIFCISEKRRDVGCLIS